MSRGATIGELQSCCGLEQGCTLARAGALPNARVSVEKMRRGTARAHTVWSNGNVHHRIDTLNFSATRIYAAITQVDIFNVQAQRTCAVWQSVQSARKEKKPGNPIRACTERLEVDQFVDQHDLGCGLHFTRGSFICTSAEYWQIASVLQ